MAHLKDHQAHNSSFTNSIGEKLSAEIEFDIRKIKVSYLFLNSLGDVQEYIFIIIIIVINVIIAIISVIVIATVIVYVGAGSQETKSNISCYLFVTKNFPVCNSFYFGGLLFDEIVPKSFTDQMQ